MSLWLRDAPTVTSPHTENKFTVVHCARVMEAVAQNRPLFSDFNVLYFS